MSEIKKPSDRLFPMQGVEVWKNPNNEFCVVQIHYTADPSKRSPEFKKKASASLPRRDFLREYEISWETWEGLPVYPDYMEEIHGLPNRIDPQIGLPLLRGWDFGLTPAAVVCQVQEYTLCAMKEFIGFNIGVERFSEFVLRECSQMYPNWPDRKRDWLDYIDPSGFARKDTDEKSCASVLQGKGLRTLAGEISFTKRKDSVEYFLTRRHRDRQCFEISLSACPLLAQGFKGGYQYEEKSTDKDANQIYPLKNKFSHIHDALQMVAGAFRKVKKKSTGPIQSPGYSVTHS